MVPALKATINDGDLFRDSNTEKSPQKPSSSFIIETSTASRDWLAN